uniref:Uncharacterized protein n=1 Tax=Rhizophora mucronata TaxID=61149 RepID=A0A2P2LBS5_RHIMU
MCCVPALAVPISEIYTSYILSNFHCCFCFRGCGPWQYLRKDFNQILSSNL